MGVDRDCTWPRRYATRSGARAGHRRVTVARENGTSTACPSRPNAPKNCHYRSLSSRLERTFGPCEALQAGWMLIARAVPDSHVWGENMGGVQARMGGGPRL